VGTRDKRLALVAAILASSIVAVDATVVNVALPAIERDLGGGLASQQWVANSYLITLSSLILIGGSLADLFGERRVFVTGVAGFGVTSVLCAVGPNVEFLIGARALQGVSGALLTPSALAVIIAVFDESERGAALGSWTAWGGIGIMAGPMLGGQIVDSASWRLIFAVNVPLVVLTLLLTRSAVPDRRDGAGRAQVDWVGGALCALGLAGPTFALIEQPRYGWASPAVLVPLLAGLALFGAFVLYEARARAPMLPLGLFRRRNFAVGNLETLAMYASLAILGFFLTLFLQQVAGYSAFEAGLTSLVPTTVMFLLSKRFGAAADRYGPRLFMGLGPLVAAVGFGLMVRFDATVSFPYEVVPALLVFSLGLAITVSPLTAAVLADADERNAGIASGTNNAIARVAGLLATAGVGAVVAGQFAGSLEGRMAERPLSPPARAAVASAERQTLGELPLPEAMPGDERALLAAASRDASVSAFRAAAGIGTGLLVTAGVVGLVGVCNPRRRVRAEHCPGGHLVGAPREAAHGRIGEGRGAPVPAGEPARAGAGGPAAAR
jgi:EmrB/QacA subfamily drug resistance transporter